MYNKIFKALALGTLLSTSMTLTSFARTEVHVLDVAQGLSILIESDGHYLLYDGGNSNKSSFVVAYLEEQGVTHLDYVIASHFDADHINGLVGALNVYTTDQVFAPEYTTTTRVFQSFEEIIIEKNIPRELPDVGAIYELGNATFQILSPLSDSYSDFNDYSIAIRVMDGDDSFLITGDAEAKSEAEIVANDLPLESDVYVMGHHGSGTSSSWDLLQRVVPEYAILSCGTGNSYGHPHIESMEKLEAMEIELFRTDTQGTIIGIMDHGITWNVEPSNDYSPGNPDDEPAQASETQSSNVEEPVANDLESIISFLEDLYTIVKKIMRLFS